MQSVPRTAWRWGVAAALTAVAGLPGAGQPAAAPAGFAAGTIERVFERRGDALVTAAFTTVQEGASAPDPRNPAAGSHAEARSHTVALPGSSEFALVITGRPAPLTALDLASAEPRREGDALLIGYAKDGEPLRVTVRHEPGPTPFTLRKRLEIENRGAEPVTLEEIHVESFAGDRKPGAGGRGQPFMIDGALFLGLEHPIAEQAVVHGRAVARHWPSSADAPPDKAIATLPPGATLVSKTAVAGLAPAGQAEAFFETYVTAIAHRRPGHFAWVYNTWAATACRP